MRSVGFTTALFALLLVLLPFDMVAQTEFMAGDVVSDDFLANHDYREFFTSEAVSDSVFSLMQGKSWKNNCTTSRSALRYLRCLHKNIDGESIVGEMIVNEKIAQKVLNILCELYENDYPIEKMLLIDYWDGVDEQSMQANNSSSFNFRFISHTTKVSKHGEGMAVDINPLYNPYVKTVKGKTVVEPSTARAYLDRTKNHRYMIKKGDLCYRLFIKNGFRWGGDWKYSKDYQHFEM